MRETLCMNPRRRTLGLKIDVPKGPSLPGHNSAPHILPGKQFDNKYNENNLKTFMGVASIVTAHVYVGDIRVAQNYEQLKQLGVACILNCTDCPNYFAHEFTYKRMEMDDNPTEDILCLFYDAIDFIGNAVESNRNVLIHCKYGISRSSAMTIAYLMYTDHCNYQKAFDTLYHSRPICAPNAGFIIALQNWHSHLHSPLTQPRLYVVDRRPKLQYTSASMGAISNNTIVTAPSSPSSSVYVKMVDKFIENPHKCYLIHTSNILYIWIGSECDRKFVAVAHRFAKQLQKYEKAPDLIQTISQTEMELSANFENCVAPFIVKS